jgi:hypothetical protein
MLPQEENRNGQKHTARKHINRYFLKNNDHILSLPELLKKGAVKNMKPPVR